MQENDKFHICPICCQDLDSKIKKCPHCESSLYQYQPLVVSAYERLEYQAAKLRSKSAQNKADLVVDAEAVSATGTTSFIGLRIVRGVFGFIGAWQALMILPILTQLNGRTDGDLAALILIKLLAMAIFLGVYWAIGDHINTAHTEKHGTKHPSLNGFFSL